MPRVVDHAAYRKWLMEQCTQVFARHGYQIGMRDIAAALSISKGTLYYYFPTKEQLFRAVCESVVQADIAALHASAPAETSLAVRLEYLLRHCQERETWFVQQYLILTEYVRASGAEAIQHNPAITAATQAYTQAIADYLGVQQPATISGILMFINGLILQRYLDGQQTDFAHMARWMIDLVARGEER
jgi:AcrR family transcriptional regulator